MTGLHAAFDGSTAGTALVNEPYSATAKRQVDENLFVGSTGVDLLNCLRSRLSRLDRGLKGVFCHLNTSSGNVTHDSSMGLIGHSDVSKSPSISTEVNLNTLHLKVNPSTCLKDGMPCEVYSMLLQPPLA